MHLKTYLHIIDWQELLKYLQLSVVMSRLSLSPEKNSKEDQQKLY